MKKLLGFTILEVTLAILISSALLAAIIILNAPFLKQFNDAFVFQRLRQQVVTPLDAIATEIKNARAAYVDSSLCYGVCLIDKASGNRVLYYLSGSDLYRKSEAGTTAIACTGGKPFAQGLDTTNSSFTSSRETVSVTLAQTGSHGASYRLATVVLPNNAERAELFYDGYGCNTAAGKGWTLGSGTISWSLQPSVSASGAYSLYETLTKDQATPLTASAEVPVNLGRISKAYLQFKYRTSGSMDSGEQLTVNFYDGTSWHQVFIDDLGGTISALSTTTVDLEGYTLSKNSRLRFDGKLLNKNDAWIIEEVSVVAK